VTHKDRQREREKGGVVVRHVKMLGIRERERERQGARVHERGRDPHTQIDRERETRAP